MVESKKFLNEVISRMMLVFPPEIIFNNQCICRFEPDGIALLKGFLKSRGYRFVDIVYPSVKAITIENNLLKHHSGWAISQIDQEGISLRYVVNSALDLSLDSSLAISLKCFLPTDQLLATRIIGFSVGFPSQLFHALILARIAKRLNPNIFVVLGGALISSYITFITTIHEMTSFVDGIIPGYGEEPLARLALCLDRNGNLKDVPNIYLSSAEGFRSNLTSWQPDKNNLLVVPDYDRPTLKREFDPYFPVRPSIGCYWGNCAFCVYPSMSTGIKISRQYIVKPEELLNHIKILMMKGSGNKFEFCSDSLPPSYLKKLSEQIIESKLDIKWNAWACVDKKFTDDGILETMKNAGCMSILLGMESACQRTLRRINKMQSRQDIDRVLTAFSSANIEVFLTVCIGFPGETYDEAMETIEYLSNLIYRDSIVSNRNVRIYRFALMCNTPMLKNLHEYGISSVKWSDMCYLDDDFSYYYEVSEGMSFEEVKEFVLKWRSKLDISTDDSPLTEQFSFNEINDEWSD